MTTQPNTKYPMSSPLALGSKINHIKPDIYLPIDRRLVHFLKIRTSGEEDDVFIYPGYIPMDEEGYPQGRCLNHEIMEYMGDRLDHCLDHIFKGNLGLIDDKKLTLYTGSTRELISYLHCEDIGYVTIENRILSQLPKWRVTHEVNRENWNADPIKRGETPNFRS